MKAIVYRNYGTPDELRLEEVEKPVPKDNEVLVKTHAASINSWDWGLLTGTPKVFRIFSGISKPRTKIIGCDIAGMVDAVGKNVKKFRPGDEVFGDVSAGNWGGFAEYTCAKETELTLKPAGMSFEQAAATPQAGLLALQGLEQGKLAARKKVLINGAGGGVGTFAIQMAKLYGAEVTGIDKGVKLDAMRSLGADYVIDYTQEDFTKNGKLYDIIFDVDAHRSMFDYKRALSTNGIYVMAGGDTSLILQVLFVGPWTAMTSRKRLGLLVHKANKGLDRLIQMFESGKVTPVIDRVFPLEQTADAFRYYKEGNFKGKVVVRGVRKRI